MNGAGRPAKAAPHRTDSLDEASFSVTGGSDTVAYLEERSRVLGQHRSLSVEPAIGRRLNLAYDPEQAARELAELLGSRTLAYRWITAVAKAAT